MSNEVIENDQGLEYCKQLVNTIRAESTDEEYQEFLDLLKARFPESWERAELGGVS